MEKLIIIGAGGYAKSVVDSVNPNEFSIVGFLDEFSTKKQHLGFRILGNKIEDIDNFNDYVYFVAIGNNKSRKMWFDRIVSLNLRLVNIIDKTAIVSSRSQIGKGCFVGKMAIVNAGVTIGDNCIINTKALVEHGCSISSHVNISTNATVNGDVKINCGSFIGSSSVIIGQLEVGSWSTVGAAAAVICNVDSNVTVAGVPAKKIKEGAMLG